MKSGVFHQSGPAEIHKDRFEAVSRPWVVFQGDSPIDELRVSLFHCQKRERFMSVTPSNLAVMFLADRFLRVKIE
jgi:hypothetical protein